MPVLAVVIALVVGVGLGALVVWLSMRERAAWTDPLAEPAPVTVPQDVSEVLAALRSAAIVVGPQDEVLQSSTLARTLGLVRGSRVANPELLGMVGVVRRDREILDGQLRLGSGAGSSYLSTRITPLSTDLVLVLADDKTVERRVEDTRRDFVANVSHELKTPIGAVSLLAEALEDSPDDPEAVRRFANRLTVESRRLTLLVGQIIDLSRLQGDDPLLEPQVVDIDQVLTSAVDLRRVDAERRGVTLTVAGEQGLTVLGSDRQLTTAIGNLVENAVVYSDAGARVVVGARRERDGEDDLVEITVSDNGIGIGPADLDRIFERFYRVDYARSRDNGGTGLGLSIVKHVASSHRGDISVWSRPGRGSTFTIKIPRHLDRSADAEPERVDGEPNDPELAALEPPDVGADFVPASAPATTPDLTPASGPPNPEPTPVSTTVQQQRTQESRR